MKTLFLDLDGTMYHGTKIVPSAKKLVDYLIKNNLDFYFFTNNSSRTPIENAKHMMDIGYENIQPEMFYNSSMACVANLKRNYPGNRVMMIGKEGLRSELISNGYQLVENGADYVVVGMDSNGNYHKYSQALNNLVNGALLVGTNSDRMLLTESGAKIGNGSVVTLLEYASSQKAIITGKPNKIIATEALEYFKLQPDDVIIVGDNLETDILCGVNAGIKTCLVLGGVHNRLDCQALGIKPDYIIEDILEIVEIIRQFT